MDRYQNVVRTGLFGHTHKEELSLTTAVNTNDLIGLSFSAGSLSTYQNRNPSFAVIDFDAEFMVTVSYKTYIFDIQKANTTGNA